MHLFLTSYYRFGQYLASTLPTNTSEQHVQLNEEYEDNEDLQKLKTTINQRNALLDVLIHLLLERSENGGMNSQYVSFQRFFIH